MGFKVYFQVILMSLFFSLNMQGNVVDTLSIQSDSISDPIPQKSKIIPRVSTLHSLMIPGWGQINNGQYWKLPLVAGAFITLGLIANYNHERYMKYRDF